jgi:hypothetical protein
MPAVECRSYTKIGGIVDGPAPGIALCRKFSVPTHAARATPYIIEEVKCAFDVVSGFEWLFKKAIDPQSSSGLDNT